MIFLNLKQCMQISLNHELKNEQLLSSCIAGYLDLFNKEVVILAMQLYGDSALGRKQTNSHIQQFYIQRFSSIQRPQRRFYTHQSTGNSNPKMEKYLDKEYACIFIHFLSPSDVKVVHVLDWTFFYVSMNIRYE